MVQVKPSPKSTPPKGKTNDQGKGHTKAKADTKKHQKKHKKVGHGHKSKKKAPKKAPKGGKKKAPKGGKSKKGAKGGKVDVGGYAKAALALAKKGAPASALLAVAKKAFKSGNVAKAKAFLAVAEAAADTQKEEPKVQKPLENLLDVLHRKQGKALTLNPAALAAQQAKAKMTHAAKPAAKAAAPPIKKAAAPKPVTAPAAKKPATVKKAITKKTTVTKSIPAHKAVTITKPKKAGKGHVEKLASKLSHGKLPTGNPKKPHVEHKKAEDNLPDKKDGFGFSGNGKHAASPKVKKPKNPSAKPKKPNTGKKVKHETFGFKAGKKAAPGKKSKAKKKTKAMSMKKKTMTASKLPAPATMLGESNSAGEHLAMEAADDMHLWVNGKPVDSKALKQKEALANSLKKNAMKERGEKSRLNRLTPTMELKNKHNARLAAANMHIWVDGRPQVPKKKKKTKKIVLLPQKLGESAEGMDKMRTMKLLGTHIRDTSKALQTQGEIPNTAEYNFSVRNTDRANRSMGTARKLYVDVELPSNAKLEDAYFYLEHTSKKAADISQSCKLEQGGKKARVHCFLPYVKSLVDVHVRAKYDGDQKALQKLTSAQVHATLHEGHEVLTTTSLQAVQPMKLLHRMPHEEA